MAITTAKERALARLDILLAHAVSVNPCFLREYDEDEDEPDTAELSVRDILADLMYYAENKGIDFEHELSMASGFFSEGE